MRGWAAITAFLTMPYGIAFLVHERPPTGGHALAGLVILGFGIFLLAGIGTLAVQKSRTNAIWLLVFQILTTAAAIVALLMQQLPFSWATLLAIFAFAIPVIGSARRFKPPAWTPKLQSTTGLILDTFAEVFMVGGVLALMILVRRFPIGFLPFIIGGCAAIWLSIQELRFKRSMERFQGTSSRNAPSPTDRDQPLAG